MAHGLGSEDWIYSYTADEERLWAYNPSLNTSRWTLRDLDGKVLREFSNANGVWSVAEDYIYRDGQLFAGYLGTGQRRYFALDHLGTPRLVTNSAGNLSGYHVYYPFGEEATPFDATMDRRQFTGHERDLNSMGGANPFADDLDYMHARYYNAQVGRFTSFDPVGGNPGAPQSWNRYSYVMGNPLKYTDPAGLFAGWVFPPVGMLVEYGSINVTASPWRGTMANPFTGVWGVGSLVSGSSFFNSLTSLSDVFYLRPDDFSFGRTLDVSGMGLAAFTDGVLPFVDPFENAGVYNPDELGLEYSRQIGELTRDVEIALASTGSTSLFGKGSYLNRGRFLRIGHSTHGKFKYFSARGEWINRVLNTSRAHIDLWIIGPR